MNFQTFFENFFAHTSSYLPGVLGALAALIIGWLIAKGLSGLSGKLVDKTGLQNRLGQNNANLDIAKIIKKFVYYIVMAIVLMVVLEMLGVQNVLQPLKDMVAQFLGALPKIIGAVIIGFVGYTIATIVSDLVGLASGTIEKYVDKLEMTGSGIDATKLIKQIVFLIIFIPLLIAAFDYLGMKVISDPAKMMLSEFLSAIPRILAAGIIIGVFYVIGQYVTKLLTQLLRNMNGDELPSRLGIASMVGNQSFSGMIGNLVFFFLMFFGVITAVEKLEFAQLSEILRNVLDLSGSIFFGLIIMAMGNFIAQIAYKALSNSDTFLASIARFAILGLFLAIALRSMGIADEIINLAFGLVLGAVAVAIALSFGLGGREAAGKQMEIILSRFRKKDTREIDKQEIMEN